MTMSSRIRISLEVAVLLVLLASCKDRLVETDIGPSNMSDALGNPSKSDGREDRIGSTRNEVAEENRNGGGSSMPVMLQEAFDEIEGGAPKLGTFFTLWQDAWDGELLAETNDLEPAVLNGSMLGRRAKEADDVDDVSIFSALRDGEGLDGVDRDLAIVVSSVFGGVLLDRDLAKDMPLFLEKQMNQLPPVEGDILIIRMAADLSGLIEPVGVFSDAQLDGWKRLRDAANPAYRLAAVRLFCRLCSNSSHEIEFLAGLVKETDSHIALIVVHEVANLPFGAREALLRRLVESQTHLGNVDAVSAAAGELRRR